ncbi:MAG: hypothetical protein EOO73_23090 [Myxococcales bacterium]|nr:MAG: hypothetical protein EOO73_23090 [Myxococcales bacterium]
MKSFTIRFACLLPLLLGCGDELEPGTKVDSLRVLAQAVDLPYAHPGETVKLTALSVDPAERPITWAWASCLNPNDTSLESCFARIAETGQSEAAVFALGEGLEEVELVVPADALEGVPAAARGFAGMGVVSAACPGDLSLEVGSSGLPFRCEDPQTGRELGLSEFIVGIKRVTVRETERNQNPELLSVTFDGAEWPPDEVKEVGWCDQDDFVYDTCPDSEKHDLAAILTPESFEAGTDELGRRFEEQLVIQYYATEGIFDSEVKTGSEPKNGWVARRSASGQTLQLWFVARDNRGGVTWAERQVRVR